MHPRGARVRSSSGDNAGSVRCGRIGAGDLRGFPGRPSRRRHYARDSPRQAAGGVMRSGGRSRILRRSIFTADWAVAALLLILLLIMPAIVGDANIPMLITLITA